RRASGVKLITQIPMIIGMDHINIICTCSCSEVRWVLYRPLRSSAVDDFICWKYLLRTLQEQSSECLPQDIFHCRASLSVYILCFL
ncbi:unnamed protein product, partial [Amoebophrya sp. A25]